MKHSVRFFAVGLFTSAILLLVYQLFIDDESANKTEQISVEEMIAHVEESGYRVITDEEFISYSMYVEEKNEQEAKKEEKNRSSKAKKDDKENDEDVNEAETDESDDADEAEEESEAEEEEVRKVKLTVRQGDLTPDIADFLQEQGIIDDKQEFVDYLEEHDYSPYIQLGTFEVSSDMSLYELAERLTTYPGD